MSSESFQAVSPDPTVIFNLAEDTEYLPEVDQEPVGDASPEIVVADTSSEPIVNPTTEEIEASASIEIDSPQVPFEDQPETQVILDQRAESFQAAPSLPEEKAFLPNDTFSDGTDLEIVEDLSSSNLDEEPENEYQVFPNNVQIEEILQGAATLQESSSVKHSKTYDRVSEFLDIPEEQYSIEILAEAVNVVRDYSVFSEVIGSGAIAVSTYHNIQEGKILNKTKEIDKKLNGKGWEERADQLFPYSKPTRCARMSIANIEGVESYCLLGTEKLRTAARAIAKTGVIGPDQIKSLHEHFGEECDLTIGHVDFKRKFDSILAKALSSTDKDNGNQNADNVQKTENRNEEKPVVEINPEPPTQGDEQKPPELADGQSVDPPVEVDPNSSGSDDDNINSLVNNISGIKTNTNTDDKTNESEKDKFLDQTSLNRWCGSLIRAISKVRSNKPKVLLKDKFSIEIIDTVIAELVKLKNDLISLEN